MNFSLKNKNIIPIRKSSKYGCFTFEFVRFFKSFEDIFEELLKLFKHVLQSIKCKVLANNKKT